MKLINSSLFQSFTHNDVNQTENNKRGIAAEVSAEYN